METNQLRQGKPVESLRWMQVHSGASSTASAPADTLFVGRAVSVVTRPPAVVVSKFNLLETEGGTQTRGRFGAGGDGGGFFGLQKSLAVYCCVSQTTCKWLAKLLKSKHLIVV